LFLPTYKSPSVAPTSVHPSWAPTRLNPSAFRCHQPKALLPRTKGTHAMHYHAIPFSSTVLSLRRSSLTRTATRTASRTASPSFPRSGSCPPSPALSPPSTLPHSPCAHTCEQSFVQECTHMCVRTCLLAQRESAGREKMKSERECAPKRESVCGSMQTCNLPPKVVCPAKPCVCVDAPHA
jgi:hypothetical protein